MTRKPQLSLETPDSAGNVPDISMLGKFYRHRKGGIYKVLEFTWNATYDLWEIEYVGYQGTGVKFTRFLEDFNSPGRFEPYTD